MIQQEHAIVYRCTTKGRRYLSLKAATRAEAEAIIKAKYPTEPFESDTGNYFHWSNLPRSNVLLRRMCRLVRASLAARKGEA